MSSSAFIRKVATAIERDRLARHGEHILVAVSGGADSVALLTVLHGLVPLWGFRLTAAHLDHGLRGADGLRDREFVEALAQELGYPCITDTGSLEPTGNLEARARSARYRFLEQAASSAACDRIAVGHTQNDQAETVLLRLLRGAGTRGLGGMAPRRGRIIRPLLDTTREEILAFLHERGLRWVEDRSNRDDRFTRNRVRHHLLPALAAHAGPRIVSALANTADLLRKEDEVLEEIARQVIDTARSGHRLEVRALKKMPAAIRRRVLRLWLATERGSLGGVSRAHLRTIERAMEKTESRLVALPRGSARCEAGFLGWEPEPISQPASFSTEIAPGKTVRRPDLGWEVSLSAPEPCAAGQLLPQDRWTAVFDVAQLPRKLVLRSVYPGDRIRPLALGGTQKLQDVLVNAKVPRSRRPGLPLLAAGTEVLWVPGLSRSVIATLTPATKVVVWARFRLLR
jgi:tRNA(Ile)-lysidine synthase